MNNIESLIFYIITFSISAMIITKVGNLYRKMDTKANKLKIMVLTVIGLGIPILIGSIRFQVGTDYENYRTIYENRQEIGILEGILQGKEILVFIIIKIAAYLNNYQLMLAIITFLTIIIFYKAILDYKEKISLGFMFFLYLFLNFTTSFNIIRQALAMVIVLYSYKFMFKRNFIKFLLTIIIASMFHITALIFLPFYFICSDKLNKNKKTKFIKICAIIVVIFIVLNYADLISTMSTNIEGLERYESYSQEKVSENREAILDLAILVILFFFRKRLIEYDNKNDTLIFLYLIGFLFTLTGYRSAFVKRIAMYFEISSVMLIATFPQLFKNNAQKMLVYFLIILYAIGMFIISTYVLKQGNILPYQTIFEM